MKSPGIDRRCRLVYVFSRVVRVRWAEFNAAEMNLKLVCNTFGWF